MTKKKTSKSQSAWCPLVAFDFDGVLHEDPHYTWPLRQVNFALIRQAHQRGYAVAIMTCNDVRRVADVLRRSGFSAMADVNMYRANWSDPDVVLVTNRKLSAVAYVDDKALYYRFGDDTQYVWDTIEARRDEREGFRPCVSGRHWGRWGAAGVLPWTVFRGRSYVLLGKRSGAVQARGTWSVFGGALDSEDEDTWQCATRELHEEVKGLDGHLQREWDEYHVFECPDCGWWYVTFLAEVEAVDPGDEAAYLPRVRGDRFETADLRWVRAEDVDSYELHPAFAQAWPALRAQLESVSEVAA